jgi:hypothetical protein
MGSKLQSPAADERADDGGQDGDELTRLLQLTLDVLEASSARRAGRRRGGPSAAVRFARRRRA